MYVLHDAKSRTRYSSHFHCVMNIPMKSDSDSEPLVVNYSAAFENSQYLSKFKSIHVCFVYVSCCRLICVVVVALFKVGPI